MLCAPHNNAMSNENKTPQNTIIYVCRSCRAHKDLPVDHTTQGAQLMRTLEAKLTATPLDNIEVRSINCLSQCKHPASVAFQSPDKFQYLVSSLNPTRDADDILTFAQHYHAAEAGIVMTANRPESIRNGLVGRLPPFGYEDPAPEYYKLPTA